MGPPLRATRGFTPRQRGRAGRAGERHNNTIKPHKCASDSLVVIRKVVPAPREGRRTMARVFPGRLQLLMCKLLLTHGQQQVQLCCNLSPHTRSCWSAALAVRESRAELILHRSVYSLPEGKTVLRSGDAEMQTCCCFVCSIDPGDIAKPLTDKKTHSFFVGFASQGFLEMFARYSSTFSLFFFFFCFRTVWMLRPFLPQH